MREINGFTEAEIISSLRLSAITAMDEGSLSENEYGACCKYLEELEDSLKYENCVECWECDTVFHYTDSDIDNAQVKCPCCGNVIVLLD